MIKKRSIQLIFLLCVVLANIGCDQVSKAIVRKQIDAHEHISLIDQHLILTRVENTGAFLSLGEDLPPVLKVWVLTVLPTIALFLVLWWLFQQAGHRTISLFAAGCIAGGGIGNVYDRIVYGSVTDFIYIHAGFFRTGIFNFADISITAGIIVLITTQYWQLFKEKRGA